MVEGKDGRVKLTSPKEEHEDFSRNTVIYRCVSKENNEVVNQPLEQIGPIVQNWIDEANSRERVGAYGTIEYVFRTEDVAYVIAKCNS